MIENINSIRGLNSNHGMMNFIPPSFRASPDMPNHHQMVYSSKCPIANKDEHEIRVSLEHLAVVVGILYQRLLVHRLKL